MVILARIRRRIVRYYDGRGPSASGSGGITDILDVVSLYEYIIESRERFLGTFREIGWEEFTKDRGATWNSMQGIFVHMLEVEDSWLHYDIAGKPWPYGDRAPSAFRTFDEIDAYHAELAGRTRAFLDGLTDESLGREVLFDWAPGRARSSVEDVLIHAFIDELAHLGELICLLWQMDVQPPHVNWIAEHIQPAE